ncbi:MAG: CBS domain-containing protein [Exiguobacterium sp.]|nr:CBS domain-containing protein [Exiguobacterium sp.]
MNIAFFLYPKEDVKYLDPESTVRQALEKMKHHRFTSVPLVSENGFYAGTMTEGDLLWALAEQLRREEDYEKVLQTRLKDIKQRVRYKPVSITAHIEELVDAITDQNFVPVVDDGKYFIGIIRRRDIIEYYSTKLKQLENEVR